MSGRKSPGRILSDHAVVFVFLVIALAAIKPSGIPLRSIAQEMITRVGRDSFLVLALLLPIYAGMGLNFGMTLGAMAGQIGLIFAMNWNITGAYGLVFAALAGLPVSVFLGWICGSVLNRAKGREMVTGWVLAYFINGIYQFVVLYLMGSVIPIRNPAILLSRGYGIRNTLNLSGVRQSLDNLVLPRIGPLTLPLATFAVIAVLCVVIVWFKRTKLGQDMRAVGFDMAVAGASGIAVDRTRIVAIIISTILACFGQIIFLQNLGNFATYNAHDQTSFVAVAAILVGGASVRRASIANVFIGVLLFHLLNVVAPRAGQNLFGTAMIGEYFRSFVGYAVIALSLVLYAWRTRKDAERLRRGLRGPAAGAPNGPAGGGAGRIAGPAAEGVAS